jgi:hypothetical protein
MEAIVTIKEQKVPLFFGMMAIEQFTTEVGALEAGSVLQTGQITCLIWAGIKNAAFRNRAICPVSFADVCDAVEDMLYTKQDELEGVMKAFSESKAIKNLQGGEPEVKKKKPTLKK